MGSRQGYARKEVLCKSVVTVTSEKVLAFDLSITSTGWAALDSAFTILGHGTIKLPTRRTNENRAQWNCRRFSTFRDSFRDLVASINPDYIFYEFPDRPFHANWIGTRKVTPGSEFNAAQGLGLAEGFVIALMCDLLIPVKGVTPGLAKMVVTGNEHASKQKVFQRLSILFRNKQDISDWPEDEVDALAIALTCMNRAGRV